MSDDCKPEERCESCDSELPVFRVPTITGYLCAKCAPDDHLDDEGADE